jgi:acyl-CoA synthetase (AMP-forming)/AMP-acid ligase II
MSRDDKLNAITRFIILVSLFGYICINRFIIIVFGLILIGIVVMLYNTQKEGMAPYFSNESKAEIYSNNPFNNVLITDYTFNPNKPEFKEEYTPDLETKINNSIKSAIIEQNPTNGDITDLFKNDSDNFELEQNSRQFHTNPITTIPNKQDSFLKFCYGTLPSEKPLIIY